MQMRVFKEAGQSASPDLRKLEILGACNEILSAEEIAVKVNLSPVRVRFYLANMNDDVLRFSDAKPWLFLANTPYLDMKAILKQVKVKRDAKPDKTLPALPYSRELCRWMGITDLVPAKGMHILEGHGSWLNPKPYYGVGGSWMEGA
jgi:hypothetical protein